MIFYCRGELYSSGVLAVAYEQLGLKWRKAFLTVPLDPMIHLGTTKDHLYILCYAKDE